MHRLEHPAYNAKHMGKLLYFFMKNVTFRVLFTEGGYPLEKGAKKVPKSCSCIKQFRDHFRAEVEIGTPSKKR